MIEILETYLKLSKDKQSSLLEFLSDELRKKLKDYKLVEDIYINDKVILIKKNKLKLELEGKIYKTRKDFISIRKSNNVNITTEKNNYYIFVKSLKNKNNDRIFFEALLKQL